MNRATASQHEKYITFRQAFQTLTKCTSEKNYMAAYVVGFSIIEDRLTAMYVIHRQVTNQPVLADEKLQKVFFKQKIDALRKARDIQKPEADLLEAEAHYRNDLMHSAMWNLDRFDHIAVARVSALARLIDNLRRQQTSKVKIAKSISIINGRIIK